jgi:hypothetical protein
MNSHYQTRLQSRMQNGEAVKVPTFETCNHNHNTRLQNRLHKMDQPKMNQSIMNITPLSHHYNTRSHDKDVSINFDESSKEWNKNKRRSGQMYYYK